VSHPTTLHARAVTDTDTMTTVSAVALGLNGGCCFAYAVLFGVMQTRLLEMYGVEARPFARATVRCTTPKNQKIVVASQILFVFLLASRPPVFERSRYKVSFSFFVCSDPVCGRT
jgi:hypothetical protein